MAKYKILKTNKWTSPPYKVGDIVEGVPMSTGGVINVIGSLDGKKITFGFSNSDLSLINENNESATKTPATDISSVNEDFANKVKLYGRIITASSIGGLALGLFFAYKRKSKVGGYIGWGLLGSAIFGGTAFAIYGKKMVQATLGNVADNIGSTQTSGEKPLDATAVIKIEEEMYGKALDSVAKARFMNFYNSLLDKEKLAYVDIIYVAPNCKKNNSTNIMSCLVEGQRALISKYGEDTIKSVNEKLTAMQKSK